MDFGEFEKDFKVEVAKLPKDLVEIMKTLAEKFGPVLDKLFPHLMQRMMRHIQTAMMEAGMGILDKEALNASIVKVLKEVL